MKHKIFFSFLLFGSGISIYSQLPSPDTLTTNSGNIIIQPIFHGSLVLTLGDKTMYIDPYNGAEAYKGLPAPDLILITDIHGDHLDTSTLNHLPTSKATIIAPQAVADKLPANCQSQTKVLSNMEGIGEGEIHITAFPMYNITEDRKMMHTKGRGNGYVIQYGGRIIYISGDTEDIPEMRNLNIIDIAFVCMNLPYTMDISQAASAVLEFKPDIVYPYHYRGKEGFSDVEAFQKIVNDGNKNIEVRLRNWYTEKKSN